MIFLCRYIRSEAFRREIHERLSVVENWNSANGFVFFGKGGEIASNRIADQEVSAHAQHLLQASLVYVNTRMVQSILSDADWAARLSDHDYRGLSPLIYSHINPYGRFEMVVHRLDRLGRSTRDVLNLEHELEAKGASLRVLEPEVTTAGVMGRVVITVLGMVAGMELKFNRDRQRAGIEAAKQKGVYKGRRKTVDDVEIRQSG